MAMRKYTQSEKLTVLRGAEANVLNEAFVRTGKYAVSEFTEEELAELNEKLDEAKETKDNV